MMGSVCGGIAGGDVVMLVLLLRRRKRYLKVARLFEVESFSAKTGRGESLDFSPTALRLRLRSLAVVLWREALKIRFTVHYTQGFHSPTQTPLRYGPE
jgi:hypothetical protein